MNETLLKLKDIIAPCCVTISLETHRTTPDNEKDKIVLKNLIREASLRLITECDKATSVALTEKINKIADSLNHRHNLESLIIFVNENTAEYIRLPVKVANRVVIDKTFATRDLVRALHRETSYYLLVLSRDNARLIEALNDKVVKEFEGVFPLVNGFTVPTRDGEMTITNKQKEAVSEFFNLVDKELNEVLKAEPLPVIVCTDGSNYSDYLRVANRKEVIVAQLSGNRNNEKNHHIVEVAWPVMRDWSKEKNRQRLNELSAAINSRNFITDINEIWAAIQQGRGRTLFIKQGYFQPARLENNTIQLVSPDFAEEANVDDIIDEMIEQNLRFGGDAVFISGDELQKYQGLVLVTRY
jgi:hypothetical protein